MISDGLSGMMLLQERKLLVVRIVLLQELLLQLRLQTCSLLISLQIVLNRTCFQLAGTRTSLLSESINLNLCR
eukprot:m.532599 g.532599  ORF g.532599 m.532599 type:complete len:73 (-) comp57596_c0_seq12:1877-2095(-)